MANLWDGYEQIKKWKDGMDLASSDHKEILDYLNTRLFQYKVEKSTDKDLWELFKEDFSNFDLETFNRLDQYVLR